MLIDRVKRFIRILVFLIELGTAHVVAWCLKVFNSKYRNVWIISERGDDARDNGYFFFSFLRRCHSEIDVFFIIREESPDSIRVKEFGNWIEYGSFKHYIYYCLATIRISSSMWGGDLPKADYFFKLRKYMSHKKMFVFLKHGIVKDFLPQHCVSYGSPDLYICGAKPEFNYVRASFGHPRDNVVYTGLARFDNLHGKKTKKQILVMPTFRRWLQGKKEEEIACSDYVKTYNWFLNSERLHSVLEHYGIDLVFYPHYVMQKNIGLFTSECPKIKIAKFKEYDVQTLLIESNLLVTDFSSVFFDFAYMEKPVIYFQFDKEKYIREHYDFTKGYFSYERDGFGPVVYSTEDLLNTLTELIETEMEIGNPYKERINRFFPLHDKNNCQRIYEEILRKKKSE